MSVTYTLKTFGPMADTSVVDGLQNSDTVRTASAIISSDLCVISKIREAVLRGAVDGLRAITGQCMRNALSDLLAKHADDMRGLLVTYVALYAPDPTKSNLVRVIAASYVDAYSTGWCLGHMEMEIPGPRRLERRC